jgi:hypothetical protein
LCAYLVFELAENVGSALVAATASEKTKSGKNQRVVYSGKSDVNRVGREGKYAHMELLGIAKVHMEDRKASRGRLRPRRPHVLVNPWYAYEEK